MKQLANIVAKTKTQDFAYIDLILLANNFYRVILDILTTDYIINIMDFFKKF